MPAVVPDRLLHVPVVQQELDNGLQVVVSPNPTLGFVAVNAWHDVGSMHDPAGRSGLAHLAEHVLFAVDGAGRSRSSNATTSFERTSYVDTGPPERLDALLARTVARLVRSTRSNTAADVNAHRAVVLEEIRQREDSARFGSGLRRSLRLRFGADHPFGRPALGSPPELADVVPADLHGFLLAHYCAADTVVSIVGSVDAQSALQAAAEHCRDLPARSPAVRPPRAPTPTGPCREDVDEGQPTAMVRLTFALPAEGGAHAVAAEVAMALLVGAPWTEFGAEFLAAHSGLAAAGEHVRCRSGPSLGTIRIGVADTADLDEVIEAMLGRLRRLAELGPDDDVLTAARSRRAKECLALLSGARSRAEELSCHQAWHGDARTVDARVPEVLAVTADDVRTVVAQCCIAPAIVAYHAASERNTSWIV